MYPVLFVRNSHSSAERRTGDWRDKHGAIPVIKSLGDSKEQGGLVSGQACLKRAGTVASGMGLWRQERPYEFPSYILPSS